MDRVLKQSLLFLSVIAIQVLVFNNISISGYINTYIYILFIILLPLDTSPLMQLLLSFALGLSVDILSGTLGMHAAACTATGFVRPYLINALLPKGPEAGSIPGVYHRGLSWFISYSAILILFHHFIYFIIEKGGFMHFGLTLLKIILSTLFSLMFVVMLAILISGKKERIKY